MSATASELAVGDGPTILDLETLRTQRFGLGIEDPHRSPTMSRKFHEDICEIYGLKTTDSTSNKKLSKHALRNIVLKAENQPYVYEQFTLQDLMSFVKTRGLQAKWKEVKENRAAKQTRREQPLRRSSRLAEKASNTPGSTKASEEAPLWRSANSVSCEHKSLVVKLLEDNDRDGFRFDFMGLPAELRSIVYHLTCRASATIFNSKQPFITRTCRLVRAEALAVYYSSNRFGLIVARPRKARTWVVQDENLWLKFIHPLNLASIRHFEFTKWDESVGLNVSIDFHEKKCTIALQEGTRNRVSLIRGSNRLVFTVTADKPKERKDLVTIFDAVIKKSWRSVRVPGSLNYELKILRLELEAGKGLSLESVEGMVNVLCRIGDENVRKLWGK